MAYDNFDAETISTTRRQQSASCTVKTNWVRLSLLKKPDALTVLDAVLNSDGVGVVDESESFLHRHILCPKWVELGQMK